MIFGTFQKSNNVSSKFDRMFRTSRKFGGFGLNFEPGDSVQTSADLIH